MWWSSCYSPSVRGKSTKKTLLFFSYLSTWWWLRPSCKPLPNRFHPKRDFGKSPAAAARLSSQDSWSERVWSNWKTTDLIVPLGPRSSVRAGDSLDTNILPRCLGFVWDLSHSGLLVIVWVGNNSTERNKNKTEVVAMSTGRFDVLNIHICTFTNLISCLWRFSVSCYFRQGALNSLCFWLFTLNMSLQTSHLFQIWFAVDFWWLCEWKTQAEQQQQFVMIIVMICIVKTECSLRNFLFEIIMCYYSWLLQRLLLCCRKMLLSKCYFSVQNSPFTIFIIDASLNNLYCQIFAVFYRLLDNFDSARASVKQQRDTLSPPLLIPL